MMKQFILIISIVLTILSCNSKPDGFVLNGKIDGINDGTKVTLRTVKDGKPFIVDSTTIQNGSFMITGKTEYIDVHFFNFQNVRGSFPFILDNKELNFTLYKDSLAVSKIEGSIDNEIAQNYMKTVSTFKKEFDGLRKEYQEAQQNQDTLFLKAYNAKVDAIKENNTQFNINYVKEQYKSIFSVLLLESLEKSKTLPLNEVNKIYESYSKQLQESTPGKRLKEKIDATLATAEGSVAPDFTAPTPDGKEITLSKVRGKVTIVDFWAAWCGPCRKENPNVVKIYEKYHDKGLEIVGVSLDGTPRQKDAKKAWLDAIEKDGLTWHQVSNLNYFNDPVARKYNIRSIPATFILDSEGKIVAKNLRGPALEKKIAELLD